MTPQDLVDALKKRYESAEKKEAVLSIHLFGIEYSAQLKGQNLNDIAELATGYRSYGTEIRKGIRLARYVDLRAGAK